MPVGYVLLSICCCCAACFCCMAPESVPHELPRHAANTAELAAEEEGGADEELEGGDVDYASYGIDLREWRRERMAPPDESEPEPPPRPRRGNGAGSSPPPRKSAPPIAKPIPLGEFESRILTVEPAPPSRPKKKKTRRR